MNDISNIFYNIKLKIYECKTGKKYFDPIRKMFICITPEENVRQRMIIFLQSVLNVPSDYIFIEDHLNHYGVNNYNGRIDISILDYDENPLAVVECKEPNISIEGIQVYMQAKDYAEAIGAKYIILVNGHQIQFYKSNDNKYVPIEEILNYDEMVGFNGSPVSAIEFERFSMSQYKDIDFLKTHEWYRSKIGKDTEEDKIPTIINFDDCLWDFSHKLKGQISDHLEVIEDLGVQFMNYGDYSGSNFGTGYYRLFLINNKKIKKQFLAGLSIISTLKTVGDPKYGNRDGLTVLVVSKNDGDFDETSVQINLNKFLHVDRKNAVFTHDATVTRKGASKKAAIDYIERNAPGLVKDNIINLGTIDNTVPMYIDNDDIKKLIGRIFEYSIYRDEYKHSLNKSIVRH